ncbi:hypothetical protein EVAR_68346_1 [Eumeta japonica]|uniref:DUF4794 domain-containing protein n=1 Tax=Eumeta variegata TaxID=151549 RepID=A0A4C1SH89_EUMVA|nr:hypothetical protein EVAR_68346_1 [Eumeta japonica]
MQSNKKLTANQKQEPYPPAGVTPEIPFDLPTEIGAPLPDLDQTYIPPKLSPGNSYLPPAQEPETTYGLPKDKPDDTYGPPFITEIDNIAPNRNERNKYATEDSYADELYLLKTTLKPNWNQK